MRHRELDRTRAGTLGPRLRAAGERHAGFRSPRDLDLAPGEADAGAQRLPDRLLAGEAGSVVLRRVRPRVAVHALRLGEAALAKARIPLERSRNSRDLDQVDADP